MVNAMKNASNIIDLVRAIVNQMTPVITITGNVIDGANYTLSMCHTYWITKGMKLTINSVIYTVEDFVINESITISGASQPVVTFFQLPAPEFWHGARRKVNNERGAQQDIRNPFVYLPIPRVRETGTYDSDIEYTASIRPIFLMGFIETLDNISDQQTYVIDPLNEMADLFLQIVDDNEPYFNEPEDIERREWPNFGNEAIWGNDELIFDQPLSGVELNFDLEVLDEGICDCDTSEIGVCAPVSETFNGTAISPINSGGTKAIVVQTDDLVPVQTGTIITDTPSQLTVEVIASVDPVIYYNRPIYTQTVSYQTYDEAWERANGANDYISNIPANARIQQLDPVNFDMLMHNNIWGHKYRFTGKNGGYYDITTDAFYLVDGTLSDFATTFPEYVAGQWLVWDHLTGYMLKGTNTTNTTHILALSNTKAYNLDGYTGWQTGTLKMAFTLHNPTVNRDMVNTTPPRAQFDWDTDQNWTATIYLINPATAVIYRTFGITQQTLSTTSAASTFPIRDFSND